MKSSAPAAPRPRAHALGGARIAEADVVGDGAAHQRRVLGHPRDRRRQASIGTARSSPPTRIRPPVGSSRPSSRPPPCSCRRRSRRPARPSRPGASSRSSPSSTGAGRAGRRTTPARSGRAPRRGSARAPAAARRRGRRVEQREHPLRHREPVGAGVVLAPSRRKGRYSSGASTITVRPAWSPRPPLTSRTPASPRRAPPRASPPAPARSPTGS